MTSHPHSGQLGFDDLLRQADDDNHARQVEKETGHLPSTLDEAIPFFRDLLERHHSAMLAAHIDEMFCLRKEAHRLAVRLNHGDAGILAEDDSPGYVLERATVAASGAIPLWGQKGDFVLDISGMRVRVEMESIFGIGTWFQHWPGFSAHAIEWDRPFLSPTGYRSFLGIHAEFVPGLTPDRFTYNVISSHVQRELKGRLIAIGHEYRQRHCTVES